MDYIAKSMAVKAVQLSIEMLQAPPKWLDDAIKEGKVQVSVNYSTTGFIVLARKDATTIFAGDWIVNNDYGVQLVGKQYFEEQYVAVPEVIAPPGVQPLKAEGSNG